MVALVENESLSRGKATRAGRRHPRYGAGVCRPAGLLKESARAEEGGVAEGEPKAEDLVREEAALAAASVPELEGGEGGEPMERRGRYREAGSCNAFDLYLREIGQVKLLTPAEELELAGRVRQGDRTAREQMIKANLRLVVKIARDYEGIGLPLLDLISEGNLGLMKAVERFDPTRGGRLSTYSSWWIKQAIKRALCNQSKTIRLPVHLIEKITRMRRAANRLRTELGREPTEEELAEVLGLSATLVNRMRVAALRPASLDAPMGDDHSSEFAEVVQDESASTPYEQLDEKTFTGLLQELVQKLSVREGDILKARFGLDGERQQTLEEIGRTFGVTRERVRQILNGALRKLRHRLAKLDRVATQPCVASA
jgi:RNA polymerase primary sigma factor